MLEILRQAVTETEAGNEAYKAALIKFLALRQRSIGLRVSEADVKDIFAVAMQDHYTPSVPPISVTCGVSFVWGIATP